MAIDKTCQEVNMCGSVHILAEMHSKQLVSMCAVVMTGIRHMCGTMQACMSRGYRVCIIKGNQAEEEVTKQR